MQTDVATLVREDAPEPDQTPALELRRELLALQQRLETVIEDSERHRAEVAADPVATERIAALAAQAREFHHAVQERRRPARWWQRWFRSSSNRRARMRTGAEVGARKAAAERADAAREAQLAHQLFATGLHHLR